MSVPRRANSAFVYQEFCPSPLYRTTRKHELIPNDARTLAVRLQPFATHAVFLRLLKQPVIGFITPKPTTL
jgi:hypothetical protein